MPYTPTVDIQKLIDRADEQIPPWFIAFTPSFDTTNGRAEMRAQMVSDVDWAARMKAEQASDYVRFFRRLSPDPSLRYEMVGAKDHPGYFFVGVYQDVA